VQKNGLVMQLLPASLLLLSIILTTSVHAECVGIAKEEYCLGKPPPNKAASMMDDGIYIRRSLGGGHNTKTYTYEDEFDKEIGLPLSASASIHKNKIVSVTQSYLLLDSDSLKKSDKIYTKLVNRLISRHKKPNERIDDKDYSIAVWDSNGISIRIEATYREISVTYEPLHKGQPIPSKDDKWLR
jgi:hypothetical protein